MKGMRTRYRERQAVDRISGHHAVIELVEDLIARHGADAPLRGSILGDAKAAYWHGYTTLNLVDSRAFVRAAVDSLEALDRVLWVAKRMEVSGDRSGAPLLIDLKRRVIAAESPQHPYPAPRLLTPRRRPAAAGAAR
jgi:hypothetical protein